MNPMNFLYNKEILEMTKMTNRTKEENTYIKCLKNGKTKLVEKIRKKCNFKKLSFNIFTKFI